MYFERFHDKVQSFCNSAMEEPNSSWRNAFYITDLDKIEAIAFEIGKRQLPESPLAIFQQNASVFDAVRPKRPTINCHAPPTASMYGQSPTIPSSSSSASNCTQTKSSVFTDCDSISPSATMVSQTPSTSPQTLKFPTTTDGITRCQYCGATFKGSLRNRRSNLQRHWRTARIHNSSGVFKCSAQGCGSVFGRSDNLSKHTQTAHGTPEVFEEQGTRKKRRGLDS